MENEMADTDDKPIQTNAGITWKNVGETVIVILIAVGGFTIGDLYGRDVKRQQEIVALMDKHNKDMINLREIIIGKDRYTSDMVDLKADVKYLIQLHVDERNNRRGK